MPIENGAKVANEWQPMSAEMCVGPMSRWVSLSAANTGRSGQPVQKFGGRGGISPTRRQRHNLVTEHAVGIRHKLVQHRGRLASTSRMKFAMPRTMTSPVYSPALGSAPLPWMRVWMSARRSSTATACSI